MDPTTTHNPFKHQSQPKKKKNHIHHSDPRQKPQPPLTNAVTHDPTTTQTPDPIEKEEIEEMVFRSEERREQMEKQRRKREKRTEVGERNFGSGIKYVYIF